MVTDPALCAELGKNARDWVVTNRSWDRAAASIVELYRKVGLVEGLPELTEVPGFPATVWQRLHARGERARQEAILGYPWTGRILDVGSERGFVACLIGLRHRPDALVSVEPNPRFLEQSRALAEANGVANFSAVAGTGEDIPCEPGSFDRVLISGVLENATDPLKVLREVARVLAPDGTALITVHAHGETPPSAVLGEKLQALLKDAGLRLREHRTVAAWEFSLVERAAPADLIREAIERLSATAAAQETGAR
jgi:SAM-dependent methyltransferase